MIYLDDSDNQGNNFLYSDASVVVTDSSTTKTVNIPKTTMLYYTLGQALLFGGYRSKHEVDEKSDEEQRNTLIVEMED